MTTRSGLCAATASSHRCWPNCRCDSERQRTTDDEDFIEKGHYVDKIITNDTTGEKIYVSFFKSPKYYYEKDSSRMEEVFFEKESKDWIIRSKKKYELPNKMEVWDYVLSDTSSSRAIWTKFFNKEGVGYSLTTEIDTLTAKSSFLTSFYQTFTPADTIQGVNPFTKKSAVFFNDFFSKDSLLHKKAVKSITIMSFDTTDIHLLKRSINSLTWKEKKYLDIKKDFINKLSHLPSVAATDYLKTLYTAAGDTLELQHAILENLLQQKTAYSYTTFKNIVLNEPPVLSVKSTTSYTDYAPPVRFDSDDYDYAYSNGNFMDDLSDSLKLTATIFKELLPLINLDDYKQPVMEVMKTLVDSGLLAGKEYELYLPKFLIEAKQEWKKQSIAEKNEAIEKAQNNGKEATSYKKGEAGSGNYLLNLYAGLLIPFWNQNPAVPTLLHGMLSSSDKLLKYNTAVLLVKNNKPVSDTLLNYFASLDDYRYNLYAELKELNKIKLFPAKWNDPVHLGKSKLLNSGRYNRPDTIQFLEKRLLQYEQRKGYIYIFKYKEKKDDVSWKLATAGLVPEGAAFEFEREKKKDKYTGDDYDFTQFSETKIEEEEPLKEQLDKIIKRLVNSKRKSAAQFYTEERSWGGYRDDY
jgi:hypothetical protein